MYVIKSNRKTNSYTVRKINRVTQVVRVGRRGLQGGPGTTDYNQLENLPDLTLKADKATTYTKTEVDTALSGKAEQSDLGSKVAKGELVFNVKDYGAVGNGSTDDTSSIQAALTAAAGATIFIPEGVFIADPTTGLQIPANTTLMGTGRSSIIKIKDNINVLNNLIKAEDADGVHFKDFAIDGNRANQAASDTVACHYGIYISGSDNCRVDNVTVYSTTGVGIHVYNSVGTVISNCDSSDNRYHGFELEQTTSCSLTSSRGHNNLRHGVFLSPGEVGGTGAIGNIIANNNFDHNGQYGFAAGIDAAGGSIGLSRDNVVSNNSMKSNAHYGVSVYRVDDLTITSNIIEGNGYIGLYLYRAERNQVIANRFRRNSQANNGAYDEILIEGANDGQASQHNLISNNFIYIDGSNKANWAIREATTGDGPNVVEGNYIPNSGVAGRALIQHVNSRYSLISDIPKDNTESLRTFDDGLAIAPNATLPGNTMGLDAPFGTAALRFFNDNNGGNLQFVSPNGNSDWYAGGNNVLSVTSNHISTHGYPIYVNSTASIDGSIAGQLKVTGLFMPVQATTAGAPAYVKGAIYFDTTLNKLRVGGATTWETVTSA